MFLKKYERTAALVAALLGVVTFAWAEKPNIILYLSDDLGYGDLAFMGHPYAKTPNIDRLAKEGTVFMQHYSTGATCAPSRAGLMSGAHPSRYAHYVGYYGTGNRKTITEVLHENGYVTGHFGKWHMGPDESVGSYGYDVIFSESNNNNVFNTLTRDEPPTDHAIEFIEQMAKEGKPFYVNLWGHSAHHPVKPSPELVEEMGDIPFDRDDFADYMQERFDRSASWEPDLKKSMSKYVAEVYGLDKNVGRIMETLERLGIEENTILVFSSDNGPQNESSQRTYAENMLGYPGEHRGYKGTYYEGGVNIPFIIRWPGKVQAGRVDDESVTSFIDWLPTLASLTGATSIPEQLDGEDISDIWLNGPRSRKNYLFWTGANAKAAVAIREGQWKLIDSKEGVELFDLLKDRSEKHNVIDKYPEVADRLMEKINAIKANKPTDLVNTKPKKKEFDRNKIAPPKF